MSSVPQSPLHADFYADGASFSPATVIENVCTARDTYRMRIEAPAIAERITPGQFIMVRLAGQADPMLGRAFAVYDVIHGPADPRGGARLCLPKEGQTNDAALGLRAGPRR